MAKPISQSDTEFIKGKGVVYKSGPNKGKKVTGKVKITELGSTVYNKRQVAEYKGGRNVGRASGTYQSKPKTPGDGSAAKSALAKRLEQNKGVKAGTVRQGAKGGGMRKYNAKTGRWERVTGVGGMASNVKTGGTPSAKRTPPRNFASKAAVSTGGKPTPTQAASSSISNPRVTAGARLANLGRETGRSNLQRSIQRITQMITAKQKAINARANKAKTDAAARAQNAKDRRDLDTLVQQLKALK